MILGPGDSCQRPRAPASPYLSGRAAVYLPSRTGVRAGRPGPSARPSPRPPGKMGARPPCAPIPHAARWVTPRADRVRVGIEGVGRWSGTLRDRGAAPPTPLRGRSPPDGGGRPAGERSAAHRERSLVATGPAPGGADRAGAGLGGVGRAGARHHTGGPRRARGAVRRSQRVRAGAGTVRRGGGGADGGGSRGRRAAARRPHGRPRRTGPDGRAATGPDRRPRPRDRTAPGTRGGRARRATTAGPGSGSSCGGRGSGRASPRC